jgi:hypothetical protein
VAGYPEAHPDYIVDDPEEMKKNYWDSLAYLKEKVCVCVRVCRKGGRGRDMPGCWRDAFYAALSMALGW